MSDWQESDEAIEHLASVAVEANDSFEGRLVKAQMRWMVAVLQRLDALLDEARLAREES